MAAAIGAPAVSADYFWTAGDFNTTGIPNLLAGDTLSITSGGTKRFAGGSFSNAGRVDWLADALQGGNSANVLNAGVWDSAADSNVLSHNFGGPPSFTNTGTFRKSAGDGQTTISGWIFINNAGTIEAQVGKIVFNGGTATFNADSSFRGAGVVSIEGDAAFNDAFRSDNLVFASGSFSGRNATFASGVAAAAGRLDWTGGEFTGTWTFGAGNTVYVTGAGSKRQVGGTIVNDGTLLWNAPAAFQGGNGGSFVNNGVFEARTSASVTHAISARNSFTNAATGVVRAAGGATLTFEGVSLVGDGGEFNAAAGSSIVYSGGFAQFNDGTRFTGPGTHTVSNSARFVGTISTDSLILGGGTQSGGTGAAISKAVLVGTLEWTGGELTDRWQIAAGSVLTVSGAGSKRQSGPGFIVNDGTVLWKAEASFQGGNNASFVNNGLFEAQASTSLAQTFGGPFDFTNAATGVVRSSSGATLTIGNVMLVSEGGEFNARAGSSIVFSGGSARFENGTRFTGAGTHTVSNDARFVGAFKGANLVFAGGTQTGGGPGPRPDAVLQGTLSWTAGDLQGDWVIDTGSVLSASGAGAKRQAGGTILNKGAVRWNADASLQMGTNTRFTNEGLFDIATDADITHTSGPGVFANAGRLVKSSGSGETSLAAVTLTNTGVIEVRSGTLTLPDGFNNAGTLAGSGTFAVGGTLTNAGHIAPGTSPGTLTLNGNLQQTAAGVIDIEFGPGGVHDMLLINGSAVLNGTLALHCFAECSLAAGETVVILDASGPMMGEFTAITLNGFGRGGFAPPIYDRTGNRLLLSVTETLAPVPEQETYVLMLTGLGLIAWAIRRRQRRLLRPWQGRVA